MSFHYVLNWQHVSSIGLTCCHICLHISKSYETPKISSEHGIFISLCKKKSWDAKCVISDKKLKYSLEIEIDFLNRKIRRHWHIMHWTANLLPFFLTVWDFKPVNSIYQVLFTPLVCCQTDWPTDWQREFENFWDGQSLDVVSISFKHILLWHWSVFND